MSYWCDEQLVVRVAGPDGEQEIVVEQPFALVGSHLRSHIVLEAVGVRKRTLVLVAMERGIYCLYLDVEHAASDVSGRWLADDEPIGIGPFTLVARLASGERLSQHEWNPQRGRCAPPIPVLHVFCDGILKDRRRLRHPLTLVGRRPQCSLRLLGQIVSSFHGLLYWCDRRLWCLDLASSNGTRLNEELFTCREVVLGERLEVGEFDLVYYRWSPRPSTPGFSHETEGGAPQELDTAFDVSLDAAAELDDEGSILGSSLGAIESARGFKNEPPQAAAAEQLAEIERQREQMESERREAALELQQRIDELDAKAAALAAEREAIADERRRWQAEREALDQELAQRREELKALEEAMHAAREEPAASSVAQAADRGEDNVDEVAVQVGKWLESANKPAGNIHDHLKTPSAYGNQAAEAPVVTDVLAPSVAALPAGRRSAASKGELTSFVSGRLGDMEDARRRRLLLMWTAITVTALATAAAGAGVWFWLR